MKKLDLPWAFALSAMIFIAGFSQPLFLLVAWRLNIGKAQITAANDLAAIMGAIFATGGLVIAAVSIYTLINIQSVVKNTIEPQLEEVPRVMDARIRQFLEAYGYFTRAQSIWGADNSSIEAVEHFVARAMSLQPSIHGMVGLVGDRFYRAAALWYLQQRQPSSDRFTSARLIDSKTFPSVASKASVWLERAFDERDVDPYEHAARRAEIGGMLGDNVHEVTRWIERANDGGEKLLPSGWPSILFLFGAINNNNPDDVLALSRALNFVAPMTPSAMLESFRRHSDRQDYREPLQFVVVPKAGTFLANAPMSPGIVTIRYVPDSVGDYKGAADWLPAMQPYVTYMRAGIPALGDPDAAGVQQSPQMIPMMTLFEELNSSFFVLCEATASYSIPERK